MTGESDERQGGERVRTVGDGGKILLDRIFGALSHRCRRYILYYLREHGTADVDDVVTHVAIRKQGVADGDVSEATRQRIKTDIVHTHIEKLEDYRLVDYDRRSETVCYSYPPTLLNEIIDIAATFESPP